jgi:hypothetical protein
MNNKENQLSQLIEAAKAGDEKALDMLSKIAFGGNPEARTAIQEIDDSDWQPVDTLATGMIWPGQDNENWEGPKRGDVPIHNNL